MFTDDTSDLARLNLNIKDVINQCRCKNFFPAMKDCLA